MSNNKDLRMDAYDRSGVFQKDRQETHIARYDFASKYVAGAAVADIACGTGYGSSILSKAGANSVLGIDVCKESIVYAQEKYGGSRTQFMVGDAMSLDLQDSTFDFVTSFETIEHVADPWRLLCEFRRILKPNGKLILSSPNDWGLTPHHLHTWSPFETVAEIATYFRIDSLWGQGNKIKGLPTFPNIYKAEINSISSAEIVLVVGVK